MLSPAQYYFESFFTRPIVNGWKIKIKKKVKRKQNTCLQIFVRVAFLYEKLESEKEKKIQIFAKI